MDLRNHIVQNILVAIINIFVFIIASCGNTFHYLAADLAFKFIICFIWGICLNKYFTNAYSYRVSVIVLGLFSFVLLFSFDFYRIIFLLTNYSFVWSGFLLGYYWKKIKILFRWIYLLLIAIFCFVYPLFLYPSFAGGLMSDNTSAKKKDFVHFRALNTPLNTFIKGAKLYHNEIAINDAFPKGSVYLLDFYFEKCGPCKMKAKDLAALANRLPDKEFKIDYIDFGKLDDIKDFDKLHASSLDQYYDSNGIFTTQLHINTFPSEIIVDKNGIIRFMNSGYDPEFKDQYIKETSGKIRLLLNEN